MRASNAEIGAEPADRVEADSTSKGRAEFVLRNDGSVLLILHARNDHERNQFAGLSGKTVRTKTVEHYGDEVWLTFSNEPQ